ncbi:MAG: right-handed parallel beta-helix repeat-containing protein [Beijerinckiaceae bacterium]|nr:right-handed parallel beta-helix repeat-containing protein [Beijerinckiaceae bacterium]MCI0735065.1 right-handed parallel beta-helix repeat-containing protein [Beijerinckiaceae bacterium]
MNYIANHISKHIALLLALFATLTLILAGTPARAQASRTWVSGVGDDANPCSRTAPCKTFAGAISKTAAKGEINALDPGGFGGVTITKAVTIDGGAGQIAGVLVSGTNGIVINAGASDVVHLRNLDINGLGTGLNGIRFLAGAAAHVENVRIFGFTQAGIDFEPANAAALEVINSVVTNCAGGGIWVKPAAGVAAKANLIGVTSSRNLFGLRVEDRAKAAVEESSMSANVNTGFVAASASAACEINVERSVTSNNGVFGVLTSGAGATIRISQVGIFDNGTGISAPTGAVVSFGNNQNAGNGTNGAPTSTVPQQ